MLYTGETVAGDSLVLPPHWEGQYTEIEIPLEPESMPDECGIAGICLTEPDPQLPALLKGGVKKIQHRGQEAAGIALYGNEGTIQLKGLGLVDSALEASRVRDLPEAAIGTSQCRYGTIRELPTDQETLNQAAQPIVRQMSNGEVLSMSHNGQFPMIDKLARKHGVDVSSCTTDSDKLSMIIAAERKNYPSLEEVIIDVLSKTEGAYSLIFAGEGKLIALRDPHGFRPLMLGSYQGERRGYGFNSESHALPAMGAEFRREVARGEMLITDQTGRLESLFPFERRPDKLCAMEIIYLYGPHGQLKDRSVQMMREQMGRILAREHPAPGADLVVGIPDSGIPAGEGFAHESGIPYEHAISREKYESDRNFITPGQQAREAGIKRKHTIIMPKVFGKSLVVVDDSIVRGTTTRQIVEKLFEKGAREVHLRSSSPHILNPCFMGIDTGDPRELVANIYKKPKRLREYIGATSLGYLSIDGLNSATNAAGKMCLACMDGDYPIQVPYPSKKIRRPNGVHYDAASIDVE